jgi:hypothetical protein
MRSLVAAGQARMIDSKPINNTALFWQPSAKPQRNAQFRPAGLTNE